MDIRDLDHAGSTLTEQFCPRCERSRPRGRRLCDECGETLVEQGFCTTCERSWPLRVGELCPKHELPLESASDFGSAAPETTRWVTVATYSDAIRAEPPRIRLEAEGIPTFLEGERMGSQSMYQVATGGVRLQVPEELLADARVLLSQSWTPPTAETDTEDAWDDLAPEPGGARRRVMKGVIVFLLLAPLLMTLISWLLFRR